jgi:hemolysin D
MRLSAPGSWLKARIRLPDRDRNDFLPAALEIMETPASPAGRLFGALIVLIAATALLWACLGKVDVIASASGRVVPIGKSKVIQPLDTGVIAKILVADGDEVSAGAVLVELDRTEVEADHRRYASDRTRAGLDLARYQGLARAIVTGKEPELLDPPPEAGEARLISARLAMQAEAAEQAAKLGGLEEQIVQKDAEASEVSASIDKLQSLLPMIQSEADIRTKLKDLEYGNKIDWLAAEEKLTDQQQQLPILAQRRAQATAARSALIQQRNETVASYQKSILEQLNKANDEVHASQSEFTKTDQRLALRTLQAPIDGTVQQLAIHTIGGVVTPAQPLMVLVPNHGGIVVEAKVENRDVGFVQAGQPAKVKVETFNFTRYGLIDGNVISLSRDVVDDPNNGSTGMRDSDKVEGSASPEQHEAGFVARIALDRDWVDTENGRMMLGPGMAVQVEIHTGRRSIISYLLSPLATKVEESMHER